ncbi:hypothetical protein EAI_16572 [Harpegnathos saltator]|uniref:Uncharacterized protein n=1 Tax=Harpegnathos saltator TaxID=610380 RepID=E2BNU8_HARSA|nr:hypothetical protein EAI_16572 [Harpegnathos saltator]
MAGPRVCRLFVILGYLSLVLVLAQNPVEEKTTFEAAFQDKRGLGQRASRGLSGNRYAI